MADPFQTFLYKDCRALYVSPVSKLAPRLNLLDILIQKTTEEGRPVLFRVGSMLDLGAASSKAAQDELRQGLQRFWEGKGSTDETFFWAYGEVPAFGELLSSKSSLTSSLLAGSAEAKLLFSETSELKCDIGALDTACVKWEYLGSMIANRRWQPNLYDWRLKKNRSILETLLGESNLKLWIVHDILYAKTVTVNSADSSSEGGKVSINLVPGNPLTSEILGSSAPGIDVTHSRESKNGLELLAATGTSPASRVPKKFMVAFRLVGFVFNSAGNYVTYEDDLGPVEPIHRGSEDESSHSDQRAQLRGLYLKTAPEYDSDEDEDDEDDEDQDDDVDKVKNDDSAIADRRTKTIWDLQRLPIVDIDGDLLDAPLESGVYAAISNPN